MPNMTPEQKVRTARELLIEATREMRQRRHAATNAERCECGHRRDRHTVTYSIDYTGGFCMTKSCKCRWFMLRTTEQTDA